MATGWLRGVVKEVGSGDSVVVVAAASSSFKTIPPQCHSVRQEKRLILSGIVAPRLARRDGSSVDEPHAWSSREHLRRLLVGREVTFRVDDLIRDKGIEFGTVFDSGTGENAAVAQCAAGLARCKDDPKTQQNFEYFGQAKAAEEGAKKKGVGQWAFSSDGGQGVAREGGPKRKVLQVGTGEGRVSPEDLVAKSSSPSGGPKTRLGCVVESVGNPHVLRILLKPVKGETQKREFVSATVFLCGVTCPLVQRRRQDQDQQPAGPEPYAVRSKVFVENAVLGRDCEVCFEGLDKYGNVYASVYTDKQGTSLAEQMLELGLAKTLGWSQKMLASLQGSRQRQAERKAKDGREGVWHGWEPSSEGANGANGAGASRRCLVTEVVSGDTVVLLDVASESGSATLGGEERRVHLASVRAPRLASRQRGESQGEPWALEAKELLRQRLVGREVTCVTEYERKVPVGGGGGQQQQQTRTLTFCTLTYEEKGQGGQAKTVNPSELLLARGLAQCQAHRSGDDTASNYDDLCDCEQRAKEQKKGIHGTKKPSGGAARVNDLSVNSSQQKSRQFLPFLQRGDRVGATVDYVLSGHRFKLLIPKQAVAITFALSDVRCPARGEKHSDDALRFARVHCMQRDVEVEVDGVDRGGAFTGRLLLQQRGGGGGGRRVDMAEQLAARGLALVNARGLPQGSPLLEAQQRAKDQRLNVWSGWDPSSEAKEELEQARMESEEAKTERKVLDARCVCVVSGSAFYAQEEAAGQEDEGDSAAKLLEDLASLDLEACGGGKAQAKFRQGQVCLCRFSGDGKVYRALVERARQQDGKDSYEVFYLDFGNRDVVEAKDLAPISEDRAALRHRTPLAFAVRLAHVKAPSLEEDYGVESARLLQSAVGAGQKLRLVVCREGQGSVQGSRQELVRSCVVYEHHGGKDGEGEGDECRDSVQAEMVGRGLARVDKSAGTRRQQEKEEVAALREEEEHARKDRVGLWEYGDVGSDDEDQPQGGGGAWGRR